MSSLGVVSQDSAKLLSEKLALSREVAILKPEIEHLQSQLAHQKDVLAEKLALERQLNALEVELANEKRAVQKATRKQDEEGQVEAELRKRVQDLEKQLTKEKKSAQKNLQSRDNQSAETEAELESLREQLASLDSALADAKKEKTTMQKALDEMRQQIEEAEEKLVVDRRAAKQQAKGKGGVDAAEVASLKEKLAIAEEALEVERATNVRVQQEHEQTNTEAEARQQAAAAKLERLKAKLRETQDELKQCRADLERTREQTVTIPKVTTTTVPIKKPAVKTLTKKRSAAQIGLEESILNTPGQDDRLKRPPKKRAIDLSNVGKSDFSITPFLNKTVNLSDESMKAGGDDATRTVPVLQLRAGEDTSVSVSTNTETSVTDSTEEMLPAKAAGLTEKKPRGRPRTKPLADAAPSKKNLTARKSPLIEPVLEKVAEEADEGLQDQENRSMESTGTTKSLDAQQNTSEEHSSGANSIGVEVEPKKKKRKILGASNKPSLFDEDEGERVVTKRPPKASGVARAKVAMGGGAKNAFAGATFSPLKRDRRGVGASFLA